jgi:hypothetical protein
MNELVKYLLEDIKKEVDYSHMTEVEILRDKVKKLEKIVIAMAETFA